MALDPTSYRPSKPPWLDGEPDLPQNDMPLKNRGPRESRRRVFSFNLLEAWKTAVAWIRG